MFEGMGSIVSVVCICSAYFEGEEGSHLVNQLSSGRQILELGPDCRTAQNKPRPVTNPTLGYRECSRVVTAQGLQAFKSACELQGYGFLQGSLDCN